MMQPNSHFCDECLLKGTTTPMTSLLQKGARFLVVTDTPSAENATGKKLLGSAAVKVFSGGMAKEGFSKADFSFSPRVKCPHDPDIYTTKQKREIAGHCRNYLVQDIQKCKPEVILPLGAEAASQVSGRAVKINKARGHIVYNDEHSTRVLPLLSPQMVAFYPQNAPMFQADCASLSRLVNYDYDTKRASAAIGANRYSYINDLQFLIDADPTTIAFDVETTGLVPYAEDAAILTMQFCIDGVKAYTLPWKHPFGGNSLERIEELKKQLIKLLCSPKRKVVAQNGKFDLVYLATTEGIKVKLGGDSLMLAALIDENAFTKGLDILVKRYAPVLSGFSDYFDKNVDKGNLKEHPLDKDFLDYSAGDSLATFLVEQELLKRVSRNKNLLAHYEKVALPALNMFCGVERRGLLVDEDALDLFEIEMAEEVEKQFRSLLAQVPRNIKRAHVHANKDVLKALSFTRKEFITDILFNHEDGFKLIPKVFTETTQKLPAELRVPSTSSKGHLPFFFEECGFTYELAEYIKNERMLNTSIRGFKNKYIHDGLVRPSYSLTTAVTGRTASRNPNGQNAPKRGTFATKYRRIFTAPQDHYLVGSDLSQIELRLAANYANEKNMLEIYKRGEDIHITTACAVMGITFAEFKALPKEEQKLARFKAKACIAAGSLVLTKDRGSIPIEDVRLTDMLWDGVEWVKHEGIAYQGKKWVMNYQGVVATPDHIVCTEIGAMPLYLARENYLELVSYDKNNITLDFYYGKIEDVEYLKEKISEDITTRSIKRKAEGYGFKSYNFISRNLTEKKLWQKHDKSSVGSRGGMFSLSTDKGIHGRQYYKKSHNELYVFKGGEIQQRPKSVSFGGTLRRYKTKMQEHWAERAKELWGAGHTKLFSGSRKFYTLCFTKFTTSDLFESRNRPDRQFRGISSWKHKIEHSFSKYKKSKGKSFVRISRGNLFISRCFKFIKKTQSGIRLFPFLGKESNIQRAIYGRYFQKVGGREPPKFEYVNTYDPINAGKNHRFKLASGPTVFQCAFGFIYGMWWVKFKVYAKTQYGLDYTDQEAQKVRSDFFNAYPGLVHWHKHVKEYVQKHKQIQSFTGRIRHLPQVDSTEKWIVDAALRMSVNSPVQSTGSDLGLMAMSKLHEDIDENVLAPVAFIHDYVGVYVRKEHLQWAAQTVKYYMESVPIEEYFGVKFKCPIVAEASFGENMGDEYEIEGLKIDSAYDFTKFWDAESQTGILVPEQKVPENNGRRLKPYYTTT